MILPEGGAYFCLRKERHWFQPAEKLVFCMWFFFLYFLKMICISISMSISSLYLYLYMFVTTYLCLHGCMHEKTKQNFVSMKI